MTTNSKPRVIIEVRGGVAQMVYASTPIDVEVLDHDDWTEANEDDEQAKHYAALQKEVDEDGLFEVYL